jgi:hypothetical protein
VTHLTGITGEVKTKFEAFVAEGGKAGAGGETAKNNPTALKTMLTKLLFETTGPNGSLTMEERKEVKAIILETIPNDLTAAMPDIKKTFENKGDAGIYKALTETAVTKLLNGRTKNKDAFMALNVHPRFNAIYDTYFKPKGKSPSKPAGGSLTNEALDGFKSTSGSDDWFASDPAASSSATPADPQAKSTVVPAASATAVWGEE